MATKVKAVSMSEFAGLCAVSKTAISKAVGRGNITVRDGTVPINDPVNRLYRNRALRRTVDNILITGRVSSGWAALCSLEGRTKTPAILYPPGSDDTIFLYDRIKLDPEIGRLTIDGIEYAAVLVYDKAAPPPWLTALELPGAKRPARRKS